MPINEYPLLVVNFYAIEIFVIFGKTFCKPFMQKYLVSFANGFVRKSVCGVERCKWFFIVSSYVTWELTHVLLSYTVCEFCRRFFVPAIL
jgi:hypothetical protein